MTRCKHPRARTIVCMVPDGINEKPIQGFSTGGYTVQWCQLCGSLRAKHPKRFGLQTRVMWRKPQDLLDSEARERMEHLIRGMTPRVAAPRSFR